MSEKETITQTKYIDSQEEQAYRRGFHHGFVVGKTTDTTDEEVRKWRYGNEDVGAPGTPYANHKFS